MGHKLMLIDAGIHLTGYLNGTVCTETIYHEYLFGKQSGILQSPSDMPFLVIGEYDN